MKLTLELEETIEGHDWWRIKLDNKFLEGFSDREKAEAFYQKVLARIAAGYPKFTTIEEQEVSVPPESKVLTLYPTLPE